MVDRAQRPGRLGVPQSSSTAGTSVRSRSRSAESWRATSALARSLSTTASTPWRAPNESTTTGTPPPPAHTTTTPCSSSSRIVGSSTIERGVGEATTRRQCVAVGRDRPAPLLGQRLRAVGVVDRTDRLRRALERGIERVDDRLRDERRHRSLAEHVAELALEQVTDHPLALRAEHVERVGPHVAERLALQREQTDLRAVPVRDDELMLAGQLGEDAAATSFTLRCATSASSDSLRRISALPPSAATISMASPSGAAVRDEQRARRRGGGPPW